MADSVQVLGSLQTTCCRHGTGRRGCRRPEHEQPRVLQLQTWGGGCGGLLSAFSNTKGNWDKLRAGRRFLCGRVSTCTRPGWSPILVTERAEDGRREDAPGLDGRDLPGIVRIAIYDGQKRSNLSK